MKRDPFPGVPEVEEFSTEVFRKYPLWRLPFRFRLLCSRIPAGSFGWPLVCFRISGMAISPDLTQVRSVSIGWGVTE